MGKPRILLMGRFRPNQLIQSKVKWLKNKSPKRVILDGLERC